PGLPDFDADNPLLVLYEKLAVLQRAPETAENLEHLVDLFITHIHTFRLDDQSNIIKILLNYCNRQINKGRTDFISTSLSLYKTGLEIGCFLDRGKLKEITFQNIVTTATVCGEFDWADNFMKQYQGLLDVSVRTGALAMAMGQWYCEKGEYAAAIEALNHSFQEPQDIYKAKGMTIRAWCEMYWIDSTCFDLLLAQLDALEKYVRRNKDVTSRLSEGMLKFISYTRKMALLKWDGKDTAGLKAEILNEPNVVLKNWLLSK
ncbi:MAG TPA: hypothetical protein PK228_13515, partial [Saprospiraceae bacterium]|nr:hypothetical protein [Saprospiraceae bacterium]